MKTKRPIETIDLGDGTFRIKGKSGVFLKEEDYKPHPIDLTKLKPRRVRVVEVGAQGGRASTSTPEEKR